VRKVARIQEQIQPSFASRWFPWPQQT